MEIWLNGLIAYGKCAIVDPEDYDLLMRYSWYYRDGYALATIRDKEVRMHRFIMDETDPEIVIDHVNRNRLDNRKANLRRLTPLENANNRSDNLRIVAFGEEKTVAEWSRDPRCSTSYNVLRSRIYRGIPPEIAILAHSDEGITRET